MLDCQRRDYSAVCRDCMKVFESVGQTPPLSWPKSALPPLLPVKGRLLKIDRFRMIPQSGSAVN